MSDLIPLDVPCPSCKKTGELYTKGASIFCSQTECSFSVNYSCPICSTALDDRHFSLIGPRSYFICSQCQTRVLVTKIKHIIENHLYIDYDQRCELCYAPTLHRKSINLSHRCFFFPQCSGQSDLFGTSKESLVFLDFETTGLEIGRDSIIEIGALKIDPDGVEHTFQSFIKPLSSLPPKITSITGITHDMVVCAPSLEHTLNAFTSFIGHSTLIVHNANFDIPWLLTSWLRYNYPIPSLDVICTLKWARTNQEAHCSLGALSKKYSIIHNNAHRALADAVATKELYFIFENNQKTSRLSRPLSDFLHSCERIKSRYADYVQP